MKTTILKTAILLFITFISCSTNNNEFTPTLPEATQTGQNTFGCYVDGNLLIPRNGTGTIYGPDRGMRFWALGSPPNYIYDEITIHDFKSNKDNRMDIHFVNLHNNGIGSFLIKESNCFNQNGANPTINIRCKYNGKWYCSIENGGTINITRYDYDNGIVSGTFSCTVQNKDNPNETIEITQGRFDIHRPTLEFTNFP